MGEWHVVVWAIFGFRCRHIKKRRVLMQNEAPSTEAASAAKAEAAPSPGIAQEAVAISNREKQIVLWLSNVNHMMNHFQNQIVYVIYPTIARELGFGPWEL